VSPELERVCRDLWDLRVRGFVGLKKALAGPELEGGMGSQSLSQTLGSSSPGLVVYSSQAETQDESAGEGTRGRRGPRSRFKGWRGENWALPSVVDTLALVYIGCVILRQPVRIGDIVRWAKSGRIPFLGAVGFVMRVIYGRGLLMPLIGQPHAGRLDQTPTKLGPEISLNEICQVQGRGTSLSSPRSNGQPQGEIWSGSPRHTGAEAAPDLDQRYGSAQYVIFPNILRLESLTNIFSGYILSRPEALRRI